MARATLGEAFNVPFLVAFGGGVTVTFALSLLAALYVFRNRLGALGLSAGFSNTGYLGIPLLLIAYGEVG